MIIQRLFNYWIGKKRFGFYLFLEIVFGGIYFVGAMIENLSLKQMGFFGFLVGVFAFLIHLNLYASRGFLKHFEDMDHLPKKQIWHVNSFCMSVFLIICLIALPAAAFGLEAVWDVIGRWFSERTHLEEAIYPALHMETETMEIPDMEALFGEVKATPAWLKLLDEILRFLGNIAIILFFLLMLQKLCSRIWFWVIKPRQFDDDEKIYLTPTLSIFPKEKSEVKNPFVSTLFSYDEKIRRKYRREILSHIKKRKGVLPSSASPSELEEMAGLNHKVLHQLYEKARYGPDECTKEDWEKL